MKTAVSLVLENSFCDLLNFLSLNIDSVLYRNSSLITKTKSSVFLLVSNRHNMKTGVFVNHFLQSFSKAIYINIILMQIGR